MFEEILGITRFQCFTCLPSQWSIHNENLGFLNTNNTVANNYLLD